jgi:hypothetical protein
MSTYFAILTEVGEAKLANAIALGQTLKLKSLAVGDGNGNLPMPSRTQKTLVHEVRRAGLNQLTVDPANASQIIVEQVLPEDVGGWWIREIGIYDEAGDLCAVANCPPSYKPLMAEGSGRTQVVRIVLIVASTAAIELKIDPSIILATRQYVDEQQNNLRSHVDKRDNEVVDYGVQKLAAHQNDNDPHPLLAKRSYVDDQQINMRGHVDNRDNEVLAYGEQKLAAHRADADPHPLLAKRSYVDDQQINMRGHVDKRDNEVLAYGEQKLAAHQDAADPHPQYSMKEVPTLPKFDASKKLVNAEFVQRAQGSMVKYIGVGESRALTADDIGAALHLMVTGLTITIPRPDTLGIPENSGKCVRFFGLGDATGTLVPTPATNIGFDVGGLQRITIKQGQTITLMATGPQVWQVIESSADMWRNADFAAVVGTSGWKRSPGGVIEQWGVINGSINMEPFTPNLTFPVAFPNACRALSVQCMNALSTPGYTGRTHDKTLTRTSAWVSNSNGIDAVGDVLTWRAIGD